MSPTPRLKSSKDIFERMDEKFSRAPYVQSGRICKSPKIIRVPVAPIGRVVARRRGELNRWRSWTCARNWWRGAQDTFRYFERKMLYQSGRVVERGATALDPHHTVLGLCQSTVLRGEEVEILSRLGTHADLVPDDFAMKEFLVVLLNVQRTSAMALEVLKTNEGYLRVDWVRLEDVEYNEERQSFVGLLRDRNVFGRIFGTQVERETFTAAYNFAMELAAGPHDYLTNGFYTFGGDVLSGLQLNPVDTRVDILCDYRQHCEFIQSYLDTPILYFTKTRNMPTF